LSHPTTIKPDKTMKKRLYLLALLTGLGLPLGAQPLTPAQLQSDFALFRRALAEAHPAPYRYTPKAQLDAKFDSVQARFSQPMTRQAFYAAMMPLVVALQCGHTKWMAPGQPEKYPFHATGPVSAAPVLRGRTGLGAGQLRPADGGRREQKSPTSTAYPRLLSSTT
jgi:hypothetical protein